MASHETGLGSSLGQSPGVLIVSLGSTEGLRRADEELYESLRRAGARVELTRARAPRPLRTMMLTDLAWARAARAAALQALRAWAGAYPPAVIYSSVTAALLWPRPGAIRFDAPSAGNRPGWHGLWQRPLERRRLECAPLLLPWSEGALREASAGACAGDRALVLPVPIEPTGELLASWQRDIAAVTYAANPLKKGLDRVLAAWRDVRPQLPDSGPRELVVIGTDAHELERAHLHVAGVEGVRVLGRLGASEYRALVRRARVFVCAPRREDYGLAQLEALADGCLLVTTLAPGPYAAAPIARSLDQRLVSEDLRRALLAALLEPPVDFALRAREALAAFSRETADRIVARDLLERLAR